jgi:hypothetical protein
MVTPASYGAGVAKATIKWEVNHIGAGAGRGIFDDMIVEQVVVPEPVSALVMGFGIAGLGIFGKSRKKQ